MSPVERKNSWQLAEELGERGPRGVQRLLGEIATLQRHSVERFAFYSVPSMQGANVAYARRFCAATNQFACILGEDRNLLADLWHGAYWYDFDHLQGAGREVFTRWLGDRLVEMGVWP